MRLALIGERVMNDDDPTTHLERKMGHKAYKDFRNWGKVAIWLVLIVVACGLVLYLAVWANLIQ
jgi:hypothetical protein